MLLSLISKDIGFQQSFVTISQWLFNPSMGLSKSHHQHVHHHGSAACITALDAVPMLSVFNQTTDPLLFPDQCSRNSGIRVDVL
ncbi:hypothetical protein Tco_0390496 [Tanacetum coccineum]